ncbi:MULTISPECIES: flavodoxin family protein [Clostridium]|uniref:flavodoxin family protein n=1 Tax=Clostridium TaxID=1485 RepID=UPI00069D248C|nr:MULTISPECIES: flavodoxin [Clostridium]KOF55627.1 flavodoxin [Clostridium sp. DMHC 10]MCD2347672.1 flavodoxin [Clostridium guangxiense]
MKSLVVFYSLEGHTKFIANLIAGELKCDLLELQPQKEIPKTGFRKFFWGGKSAIFKEKPSLKNKIPNLEQYDTIFIGTPIWAGTYAPPINTFISDNEIKQKNIAFFASHGGGGAKKCFMKLQDVLKDNNIVGAIDFVDPKNDDEEKKSEIKKWINDVIIPKLN